MRARPAARASRRRWILAYPVFVIGMTLWTSSPSWIAIGASIVLAAMYFISELVLAPRMTLPLSRSCFQCGARSPVNRAECVACGRTFSLDSASYPPDLTLLPATKRPKRVAIVIAAAFAIPALGAWMFLPKKDLQPVAMGAYFYIVFYGFEFVTWFCLRRIVRQVDEHSGKVCTRCVYPIDESMSRCPECGKAETAALAQRDWLLTGLWFSPARPLPGAAVPALPPGQ